MPALFLALLGLASPGASLGVESPLARARLAAPRLELRWVGTCDRGREATCRSEVEAALTQSDPLRLEGAEGVLGELASSFDGIPVVVIDPFVEQAMVELRGSF